MSRLTKSRYLSGRQCAKKLWLEVHDPEPAQGPEPLAIWHGRAIDAVARALYPATAANSASAPAVEETLHQAAFSVNDLAFVADVFRRTAAGADLVEVKSSTSVKDEHLTDAAFQAFVLRQLEIPLSGVKIAHVNNEFVLQRPGDYSGLLAEADVTQQVADHMVIVAEKVGQLRGILDASEAPGVPMGAHCTDPYDCPFRNRCSRSMGPMPAYPLSVLPRGGKVAAALAEIVGTRPYEQLPFQWSVHVETSDGSCSHSEYLAIEDFGDFGLLAQNLVDALPADGAVFSYNAGFEDRVLRRLSELVPGLARELAAIADRLQDLLPIARVAYYHPQMKGSWSIKAVLPTIAPELDYAALADVRGGEGAQLAFLELQGSTVTTERREALIEALLEYCRRDTWGMVVLRRFLCGTWHRHASVAGQVTPTTVA